MISSVSGGVNSRSCMKRAGNKRAESRRAAHAHSKKKKTEK